MQKIELHKKTNLTDIAIKANIEQQQRLDEQRKKDDKVLAELRTKWKEDTIDYINALMMIAAKDGKFSCSVQLYDVDQNDPLMINRKNAVYWPPFKEIWDMLVAEGYGVSLSETKVPRPNPDGDESTLAHVYILQSLLTIRWQPQTH